MSMKEMRDLFYRGKVRTMKKSRYNYFFEHDGVKLAFNSMSCALAEIDNRFERLYDSIETVYREDLGAEERNLLDDMMAGLYVVSDDTDELDRIKFRNYQGKYSTDSCSLVIAPTMACNFGCTYTAMKALKQE